jgi:hypothetical protein
MKTVKPRLAIWTAVSKPDKAKPSDPDVKDKYSLKDQELLGLAFGEANDCEIVKIFRWPGHSRDESDIVQALEDFGKANRYEYHELRGMWRSHAFDILWCHNHSRLGRSFTLQSWVIENVIRSGAKIYRHVGGWIDKADYGGQIALGGFAGAQERERRLIQNDAGMSARAAKGLNLNRVPFPHHVVRDPLDGKAILMEVDPANRLFLDHLYELLMENVPMSIVGRELFLRYGHVNARTGRAWGDQMLYEMLHRPSFWGHSARKFRAHLRSLYQDCWGFDLGAPIPKGVEMFRNTHEPAYTGSRASDVQSAIRFMKNLKGITQPNRIHALSGLVFCPRCYRQFHYAKTTAKHVKFYYLRCASHYEFTYHNLADDCLNTRHIREADVQAFVDKLLLRALEGEDIGQIFGSTNAPLPQERIDTLKVEIERQKEIGYRLALQAAEESEHRSERANTLIAKSDAREDQLEAELRAITERREIELRERERQEKAVKELRLIPPEDRWTTDLPTLNRHLKDFFGRYVIFVLDGTILVTDVRPLRGNGRGLPYVR